MMMLLNLVNKTRVKVNRQLDKINRVALMNILIKNKTKIILKLRYQKKKNNKINKFLLKKYMILINQHNNHKKTQIK